MSALDSWPPSHVVVMQAAPLSVGKHGGVTEPRHAGVYADDGPSSDVARAKNNDWADLLPVGKDPKYWVLFSFVRTCHLFITVIVKRFSVNTNKCH